MLLPIALGTERESSRRRRWLGKFICCKVGEEDSIFFCHGRSSDVGHLTYYLLGGESCIPASGTSSKLFLVVQGRPVVFWQ